MTTLYTYWRSSSSWRVRIALNWKGIRVEHVPVDLFKREGQTPEHRARSPMGKVPCISTPHGYLTESMAIIEYLEETHPKPPLLPHDPYPRARARMLAEMINSGIQPYQNLSVLRRIKKMGGDEMAWAADWIGEGLAAFEAACAPTRGKFCVGDSPTIADVYLVPQLYSARRFKVDLTATAGLLAVEAACNQLPAFADAHADRQPDAPKGT